MHLLIVDDRFDTRESFTTLLRLRGHTVDCVVGGNAALTLMEAVPDGVITDHLMPGMSGILLVQEMRARKPLANVPVAILSGLPEDEVMPVDRSSLGLTRFFRKPCDSLQLLAWLQSPTAVLAEGKS